MTADRRKPGSIAVALRWDGAAAPRVTAKGHGDVARRILELAETHDIPVREDAPLVELLSLVDLDDEIPQSLYVAIAEIIAFAYRLKGKGTDQLKPATGDGYRR